MTAEEEDSEIGEHIVRWVKSLAQGYHLLWCSDSVSDKQPWTTGWVDVLCEELQTDVPCNWVWTIDPPDVSEDTENDWSFQWAPDLCVYRVWDPDFADNSGPERLTIPVDRQRNLNLAEADRLNEALAECGPRASVHGAPGWSAETITKGLEYWAGYYAERPDIRFEWDPQGSPSDMYARAWAALEQIKAGGEGFLLKEGIREGGEGYSIRAAPQVMDFLLEDPDQAATIMETLNTHLAENFGINTNNNEDDNDDDDHD